MAKDRKDDGWLSGFGAMLKKQGEEAEVRRVAWNEEIGPAHIMVWRGSEEEAALTSYGAWKVEGGVMVIQRRKNGYHSHEASFYEGQFIEDLHGLLNSEVPDAL